MAVQHQRFSYCFWTVCMIAQGQQGKVLFLLVYSSYHPEIIPFFSPKMENSLCFTWSLMSKFFNSGWTVWIAKLDLFNRSHPNHVSALFLKNAVALVNRFCRNYICITVQIIYCFIQKQNRHREVSCDLQEFFTGKCQTLSKLMWEAKQGL